MTRLKRITLAAVFSGIFFSMGAQEKTGDLKKQEEERKRFEQEQRRDFENFRQQYNEGIKKLDEEFKNFLEKEWKRYELFKADYPLARPKPDVIPEYSEPDKSTSEEIIVEPEKLMPKPIPESAKGKSKPSVPEDLPSVTGDLSVCNFNFYGLNVEIQYDKGFKFDLPDEINENVIAQGWELMAVSPMNLVPEQLLAAKKRMSLNDWGYYILVKDLSEKIMPDRNENVFVQWYLLTRSNYKVRLAYAGNRLYLLLPSYNTIYEVPYFTFDDQRYYLINGDVDNVFTYEKEYPDANVIFDLNLYQPLKTGQEIKTDELTFETGEGEQKIEVKYNLNSIGFYNDYPLANVEVYFDAAAAPVTKESLKKELGPLISLKQEEDAVSILLHFVQTAFSYETDLKQFGKEKVFFPEELFYYPASDCEDRAVLFSYLVRELTRLEVIGVEYPGHMATAVNFKDDVAGDHIIYEGKKYVICDPTYINAPIGATMPEYKHSSVKVIPVKK